MRKFILDLSAFAVSAAMFMFVSCDKSEPKNEEPVDNPVEIELDKTSVEMEVGSSVDINVKKGNGDYSVNVSDPVLASASVSGTKITITGLVAGKATATVSDKAGKKAAVSIKVSEKAEKSKLVLEDNELSIMKGESGAILIVSGNGGYEAVSNDENVATASIEGNGVLVAGTGAGEAVITVTDAAEMSAKIYVSVSEVVDKTPYGINMGEGYGWGQVGTHLILRCPIVRTYSEEYDFSKMSAATIECLVKLNENPVYWFDDDKGNWLNSIMGSPDYFWLRANNPTVDKEDFPSDFKFNAVVDGVELNSQPIPYGEWHHVALTFKNGEINLYVDGQLAETGASNISYLDLTKVNLSKKWEDQESGIYDKYYDFFLGSMNQQRWLNGCMSEARLWSVARSAEQLAANATFLDVNDEAGSYGLIAYWRLQGEYDEEIGDMTQILKDYSGNDFNLEEMSGNVPTATMVKVVYGEYAK